MIKRQTYREYATEAFRFYAREGSKDEYIKKLIQDRIRAEKSTGQASPTEAELIHKEAVLSEKAAELADLDAAEKTIYIFQANGRMEIIKALDMVYMKDCWKDLEWGDISGRVHHAELHIPASQAQIYRWLAKARYEFARERGLRL
jgi:hypothetical protein